MNRSREIAAGHRILPHTADVIVEAWGPTRPECLEQTVRGVVESFADTAGMTPTREVQVEIGAALDEDVVVGLLDQVLYLVDADGLVVADVALEEEYDGNFEGSFSVVPADAVTQTGPAPKGISRSELSFTRDRAMWRCHVVIDV